MATISLTAAETKLFTAVIQEMNSMPDVNFDAVAQTVGIKYAKNARQSFRKIWEKLKTGSTTKANGTDDTDAEDGDDNNDAESPKKSPQKAAFAKKALVAKKGVAKPTGPKKAAGTAKSPRKSKKQKEQEAAAAEVQEPEANEDEDMEDNEDGKSHRPHKSLSLNHEAVNVTPSVESVVTEGSRTTAADASEVAAHVMEAATRVEAAAPSANENTLAADEAPYWFKPDPLMDDEHEAYIRGIPLEAWLKWKAESGYFDLISL